MKLAIIIGVSEYESCDSLTACKNDVVMMKGIFEHLEKFEDICVIADSPKGIVAKKKLTEFIKKYEEKDVEELVFYYTGHGDRYDDDFFYLFSDFNENEKEFTSLRNTELDSLIRNLNPDLTVKIVDACYSGSQYVKSDSDIEPFLVKSAKENDLKNLYFFHSSSSEETSLASDLYSYFTYSFCKSLTKIDGSIRYRDIMGLVADDMNLSGYPKPTFVVQANNLEIFGEMKPDLLSYTKNALGLIDTPEDIIHNPIVSFHAGNSLLELVTQKSSEEYCTYEEASSNIEQIRDNLKTEFWPNDIDMLFDVEQTETESTRNIPNSVEIGRWIHKQTEDNFFAEPSYETRKYFKDEYVEIPKKPSKNRGIFGSISHNLSAFGLDDTDYQLEKVEKNQQVINGFNYTAESPFRSLKLQFKPKHSALENYCFTIVLLFSRNSLALFNAKESLPYESWDSIAYPKASSWKVKVVSLKDSEHIVKHTKNLIIEMSAYIIEDITKKLGN